MNALPQWFAYFLIGNCLVVLGYALLNLLWPGEKNRSWEIRAAVMLLCPGVGACFFLVSWLMYRLVFRTPVDLSDVVFSKERVESVTKSNEALEVNFVPLEEAIAVTDRRNLRELMMNIVRGNYQDSLSSIALALNSQDTETAHYAATVLQEALNDFRVQVQKNYQKVMDVLEDPERPESAGNDGEIQAELLLDLLDGMLTKRVLTELEQSHYTHLMDNVGEKLYFSQRYAMNSGQMEQIALRLLEVKDYPLSEKWCLRLAEHFPDTLCAFTTRLKLYFSCGDREKFLAVMEQLKKTDIIVDKETLELIRVFS